MSGLEFRVLGRVEVAADGAGVDLGGPQQRLLLALLLRHRGQEVSHGAVFDAVRVRAEPRRVSRNRTGRGAPDGPGSGVTSDKVANLRRALARTLPRAEVDRRLQTVHGVGYRLDVVPGVDRVDVEEFHALVARAEQAKAGGRGMRRAALDLLSQADQCWRGPRPLSDLRVSDPGLRRWCEELVRQRRAATVARAELELAVDGESESLRRRLDELQFAQPDDAEVTWLLLWTLHWLGADWSSAWQRYSRAVPAARGGRRDVQIRQTVQAWAGGRVPPPPPPERGGRFGRESALPGRPFVGRSAQLAVLDEALDRATAGDGNCVLVHGAAGVGKTRLLQAFLDRRVDDGCLVLRVFLERGDDAPTGFRLWRDLLLQWYRRSSSRGFAEPIQTRPVAMSGSLSDWLFDHIDSERTDPGEGPLQPGGGGPVKALQAEVIELVRQLAADWRAATGRATVIAVDDVHYADADSLLLLRGLATALAGSSVLVLATYRQVDRGAGGSVLADLVSSGVVGRLALDELDESDVAEYLSTANLSEWSAEVFARTKGLPYWVDAVVTWLRPARQDAEELRARLVQLPPDLVLWHLRELQRMPATLADVLMAAAVAGSSFDLDRVARLLDASANDVARELRTAEAHSWVQPTPDSDTDFVFRHSLRRDGLLQALEQGQPERRRLLHATLAEQLRSEAAAPSSIAYHLEKAGDDRAAHQWYLKAAQVAVGQYAYTSAIEVCQAALRLARDDVDRLAALRALGSAQAKMGKVDPSRATYLKAGQLARRLDRPCAFAEAAIGVGHDFAAFAIYDQLLIQMLEEALDRLTDLESRTARMRRAQCLALLAVTLYCVDDHLRPGVEEHRIRLSERALRIAREIGEDDLLAYTLDAICYAQWSPDNLPRRRDWAQELLALGRRIPGGEPWTLQARRWLIVTAVESGQLDEADRLIAEYAAVADKLKQPLHQFRTLVWRTMQHIREGNFGEAHRVLQQSVALAEQAGALAEPARGLIGAQTYVLMQLAAPFTDDQIVLIKSYAQHSLIDVWQLALARALLTIPSPARVTEATEIYRRYAPMSPGPRRDAAWLTSMALLTEICVQLRDVDTAARLHDALLPYQDRLIPSGWAVICRGPVAAYLAALADLTGDTAAADRHRSRAAAAGFPFNGTLPVLTRTMTDGRVSADVNDSASDSPHVTGRIHRLTRLTRPDPAVPPRPRAAG